MNDYLWLFVFVGYIVMTVVFVAACVLYMLSLPVKLDIHIPSDDAPPEGKRAEVPGPADEGDPAASGPPTP